MSAPLSGYIIGLVGCYLAFNVFGCFYLAASLPYLVLPQFNAKVSVLCFACVLESSFARRELLLR